MICVVRSGEPDQHFTHLICVPYFVHWTFYVCHITKKPVSIKQLNKKFECCLNLIGLDVVSASAAYGLKIVRSRKINVLCYRKNSLTNYDCI